MPDHYDIADPDDPNTLRVPFMWVPQGCEPDPEWLRAHPGWVRIPATMVPRDPQPDESGTQWNVQLNFPDEAAAFEPTGAAAPPPVQAATSPAVDWSTPAAKAAYETYVTGGEDPIAVWREMSAVLDNPVRAIRAAWGFADPAAVSVAPGGSANADPAPGAAGPSAADIREDARLGLRRPGSPGFGPTTPVLFVDDQGKPVLDQGNPKLGLDPEPMLRPAGLDPHFFVRKGLEDRALVAALLPGGAGGALVAVTYMYQELSQFDRSAPWDAQRIGHEYHPEFVDYATVAIGLYAAAAGIPRNLILEVENRVARGSKYAAGTVMDKTYTYLPETNVTNTDKGYSLYESGDIRPTPPP